MIEVIVEDRCTGCGDCVEACPSDVLRVGGRQGGDRPSSRLPDLPAVRTLLPSRRLPFVWPEVDRVIGVTAEQALASGQMGAFRRDPAGASTPPPTPTKHWRMGAIFERARLLAIENRRRPKPSNTARHEDIR
jgi:ferredoxin